MDKQQIVSFINENMFGIWFLIGAALVFWMQAGFAMVENRFYQSKECRQHFDEEPDGLLYWYRNVYPDRFFIICWEKMFLVLSENRDLISLPVMQILIFRILCLT